MQQTTIMVMAKNPVPGFSKTRLCPPCTPEQAATVAAESIQDTLLAIRSVENTNLLVVIDRLERSLPVWLADIPAIDQVEGGLDRRLAAAFAAVGGPAILVGMDTPHVPSFVLRDAVDLVEAGDSVLGLASDGGFWCIGFHHPPDGVTWADLFHDVPMSTDATGKQQLNRLVSHGCDVTLLPEYSDFDTFEDLLGIARLAPSTRVGQIVSSDEWKPLWAQTQPGTSVR